MTRVALIKLISCEKCPNLKQYRVYTADSFENVTGWYCMGLNNRTIAEFDWYENKPDIPAWCPLVTY